MTKAKKKFLPKDFEALLKNGDLDVLKTVFDTCDVNARGGSFKQTALAFNDCPDELARWLVERGADLAAGDSYGDTPLHARAGHWQGRIELLLELGADVHAGEGMRGTPLHKAAGCYNAHTAKVLLAHRARANALNSAKQTPLMYALQRCQNTDIAGMAILAGVLLDAGDGEKNEGTSLATRIFGWRAKGSPRVTPEMQVCVHRIGTEFEFHRSGFNPEMLEATSAGLEALYKLFDVSPVPRRAIHDGKSPIIAKAASTVDRFQELWDLLVPSSGAAATVQGEVVRIAGRIQRELAANGGANWDGDYKKMAEAFLLLLGTGVPLPELALAEARNSLREARHQGDAGRIGELAVDWVALNPKPVKLPPPDYKR